jgi:hypothetical protein
MGNKSRRFPVVCLIVFGIILCYAKCLKAQDIDSDSLIAARLMEDNLSLFNQVDSLESLVDFLHKPNQKLLSEIDSLRGANNILKEKLLKSESELKDLKSTTEINQLKLEGKLDAHNSKLEGKETEINYLKRLIQEKDQLIKEKTEQLSGCNHEKDNSLHTSDSLARALNQKELDFARTSERLKVIEPQYNELIANQNATVNKKKKIRFIQGVSLKTYRTPDWQMAPSSSSAPNDYVIINRNAGKVDFDYITGISLSLYDLTKEGDKFTSDAGIFVGLGGQNLFKNFYLGPSFKVLDFIHLNTGINLAEYEQLKTGFKEGDHPGASGLSSVLVKKWKTNFFIGFTVNLDLLRTFAKKIL